MSFTTNKQKSARSVWLKGAATVAIATSAFAVEAGALAQEGTEDTIVVTGFRGSLGAALSEKRDSTTSIDAILAEDIADFPDLNLAESLQRIPGVAITRDGGEGKNITVRGLSGLYTRTRINGMEARALTRGSNSRDFDFNMFAAELFNSIIVHKTASAELDEGSLGAVVDLNTARAFDYDEGVTFALNGSGQYNTLSEDLGPRVAGLFAYNAPSGVWGATASIAFSEYDTQIFGSDVVRWQKARFNSVLGNPCSVDMSGNVLPASTCGEVADAFHARIPRYGSDSQHRERLGITAGLQFAPSDRTQITVDGLYSQFKGQNDFKTIEVLFRGNEVGMDVTDYTLTPFPDRFGVGNDSLTQLSVDNAWVRSESYRQIWDDDFYQVTAHFEHQFSDALTVNAMYGTTGAKTHLPQVTTFMYDDRDYNGYRYDFDTGGLPSYQFNGADVTDGTNFTLTEIRDQVHTTETNFDNAELSFSWAASDAFKITAGGSYKKHSFDTMQDRRDGSACRAGVYDCDLDDDGTNDILGPQGTDALTEQFVYDGSVGAGSTVAWAAPDMDGWIEFFDLFNIPLSMDLGRYNEVEERNLGGFLQLDGEIPLGNMRLLYNGGVRYVSTKQESSGFNSGVYVTVERDAYDDWLPSGNLALWMTDDFVLRFAGGKVMARPQLSQLSPGGSVDSFNLGVNFQNPFLNPTRAVALDASAEWYFAPEALLSLAVFYKDIASFPIRELRTGTFASTGLPTSVIAPTSPASQNLEGTCGQPAGCWEISELINGPGAKLKGFEVSAQMPLNSVFDSLPPIIEHLGFIANYTYVDSDVDYNFRGTIVSERLLGLSNSSYNATLYYEDDALSARVSLAQRSDYLDSGPDRSGSLWQVVEPTTFVDFSSTYHISDNFDVTFEALNLTNETFRRTVDIDASRFDVENETGRTFIFGVRYSY